jgi:transcriptional regulator with XRE-family HTH domain
VGGREGGKMRGKNYSEEQQREIFKNNLNRYIAQSGKMQTEIAEELNVSQQRFNNWCTGIAIPRIGMIEQLAIYFGVAKSDLLDVHNDDDAFGCLRPEHSQLLRAYYSASPDTQKAVRAVLGIAVQGGEQS